MEKIEVIFNSERTKELYARYFKFERRREFKKVPSVILYGIFSALILIGVIVEIDLLWIFGLISSALLSIFLLYYLVRFQIASSRFLTEMDKKAEQDNNDFQFAFDSSIIRYKSENMNYEFKWQLVKNYDLNGEDLYLYRGNQELIDIISEKIIGKEKFKLFKDILKEKVNQRPNKK